MTTTTNSCGLTDDGKPTSRVLRPPGGGSSDIFGTNLGAAAPAPRQQTNGSSNIISGGAEDSPKTTKNSHSNIFGAPEPHVIAGKGRNQSKFNPITGEPYDEHGSPIGASNSAPAKPEPTQQPTSSPSVGGAAESSPATPTGHGDGLQAAPGKAQASVHTTSRVLNPPGGKTHQIW